MAKAQKSRPSKQEYAIKDVENVPDRQNNEGKVTQKKVRQAKELPQDTHVQVLP